MWNSIYKKIFFTAALLALVLGTVVSAEQYLPGYWSPQSSTVVERQLTRLSGNIGSLQRARGLFGVRVVNQQGEILGAVEDVILDGNRNIVSYLVITSEGKLYPVNLAAFNITGDKLELNITREQLRLAPAISTIDTAMLSNPEFESRVRSYYSEKIPAMREKMSAADETPELYKSKEILGMTIRNEQGKNIAKLNDVVFDVRHGSIAYGLAGFGGLRVLRTRTAAVPWTAITLRPDEKYAIVDADKDALVAAEVKARDLSKLNDASFARQIYQNFDRTPYWEVFGFEPPAEKAPMVVKEPMMEKGLAKNVWLPDSVYNRKFNVETITTIEGTVKIVGTFSPEEGAIPGLKLKVETADGQTIAVHAGPQKHYLKQDIRFEVGDLVTVTGSKIEHGDKTAIMACTITKGDKTYLLRNNEGKPLWKTKSPEKEKAYPMGWQGARDWLIY